MTKRKATATVAHPKSDTPNFTSKPLALEERLALVLPRIGSPAGKRVLEYIVKSPNCWTHEIARECACANVSDVVRRMRLELDKAGVFVFCNLPKKNGRLKNRFGETNLSHRWQVTIRRGPHE